MIGTWVVLWGVLAAGTPAEGSPASLRVRAESCGALDAQEVQRLVELELRTVVEEIRAGPPLRVALSCAEGRMVISVFDPVTEKTLERSVPEPADEPGRERVVALAVGQLFAASWLELLIADDDEQPAEAPANPPNTRAVQAAKQVARSKTRPPRTLELAAGAGVRGRALEAVPFAALHVDAEVRGWLIPAVGLIGRVGFDFGQTDRDPFGSARGYTVTAGGGMGWRWRPTRRIGLGGSVILAGGWTRLQGVAGRDDFFARPTQGPTGDATVGIGPRLFVGRFRVELDAEVGAMLRAPEGTIVAADTREELAESISMGGVWVGGVLRFGADLTPRPERR